MISAIGNQQWKVLQRAVVRPFVRRLSPATKLKAYRARVRLESWIARTFRKQLVTYNAGNPDTVLFAFYDLARCPPTYDIINFLAHADSYRRRYRLATFHVVFVPGPHAGFRDSSYQTVEEKRWRLKHIVIASCALHPNCSGSTLCTTRAEARYYEKLAGTRIFPLNYTERSPTAAYLWNVTFSLVARGDRRIQTLCSSSQPRRSVAEWLANKVNGKRVVTVTLRESHTQAKRNSDLAAWGSFLGRLDRTRYFPIVLRDAEMIGEPLPKEFGEVAVFAEAVWNIELRSALYELAYLNLFVSNGPIMLGLFNENVNCLIFKVLNEREVVSSTKFL
ncbi:MAG: hypothetical protein ACKVKG_17070, partial [Alphaproteobacteria bacterium]